MTILVRERTTLDTLKTTGLSDRSEVSYSLLSLIEKVQKQISLVTQNPSSEQHRANLSDSISALRNRVTVEPSGKRSLLTRIIDAFAGLFFGYDRKTSAQKATEALSQGVQTIDAANSPEKIKQRKIEALQKYLGSLTSETRINAHCDRKKGQVESERSYYKSQITGPRTEWVPGNDSVTWEPVERSVAELHKEIDDCAEGDLSSIEWQRHSYLKAFEDLKSLL